MVIAAIKLIESGLKMCFKHHLIKYKQNRKKCAKKDKKVCMKFKRELDCN